MLKRIFKGKAMRAVTSTVGGILGIGGGLAGGLEIDLALLIGATALITIFAGFEKAKKFYELIHDDVTRKP